MPFASVRALTPFAVWVMASLPYVIQAPQVVFVAGCEIRLLPSLRLVQVLRMEVLLLLLGALEGQRLAERVVGVDPQVLREIDVRNPYRHIVRAELLFRKADIVKMSGATKGCFAVHSPLGRIVPRAGTGAARHKCHERI